MRGKRKKAEERRGEEMTRPKRGGKEEKMRGADTPVTHPIVHM